MSKKSQSRHTPQDDAGVTGKPPGSRPGARQKVVPRSDLQRLEDELKITRKELQSTIEQLENSHDQLKASNEELKTSKDELHSINEEVNTINGRLQEKVEELEGVNNDVINLLSSTNIATVFLDKELKVKQYTPASTRLFSLIPSDIGRPIRDVLRRFTDEALLADAARVLAELTPLSREVQCEEDWWYIRRITPYLTQDDRIEGVVVTFLEVTELKQTEKALRRAKEEWERTFNSVPDLIAILDDRHRVVRANRAMAERLGRTPDECVGLACYTAVHGTDVPPAFCPHARTLTDCLEHTAEVREERLGGHFLVSTTPICDEQGKMIGSVHVARDITERKRAEEALRESEERYRSLFDNMTEGFALHEIITDENGRPCDYRFLSINPSFERLTGLKRADVLDKRVLEVLPNNDPHWIEAYGKVALTGEPMCFENFATPLDRWYEVFAYKPAPRQFAVIFMDITARKQAQLAVEAARAEAENERNRLEAVMDALPVGVAITDANGGTIKSNIAYEQIWGGPRPVAQSVSDYAAYKAWWADTGKPVEPEEWASAQAVRKGLTVVDQIIEIHAFDGGRRFVLNGAAPVRGASGTIVGSAVTIQDITSLRRAEEALRQREEDLNFAQAVAHTGSWRLDVRRNALLWSDENHRIFGIPKGTPLTYEAFLGTVHSEDREYVERKWTAALRGEPYDIEHRIVLGETVKWVRERAELELDEEGSLLGGFGTTQDITERKEAEEALRKAHDELEIRVQERTKELDRRNQELQEFVFVAAHDLREPLRKIQTFGDLVVKKPGDALTDADRDYISRMQRAAARMQKLLGALLGYSRVTTHVEPFQDTDLSKSVEVALSNLEIVIGEKKARLEVGQLPTLQADKVQMAQLLQNLISNALKFQGVNNIPHVKIYAKAIENRFGRKSAYEICVEDNGIGFEEQYVDKIFKPFQRLHGREEYEGVGIGLAICRKIVERHGGTITARSTVGQGSTFSITLPIRQGTRGH